MISNFPTTKYLYPAAYSAMETVSNVKLALAEHGINLLDDPKFIELLDELQKPACKGLPKRKAINGKQDIFQQLQLAIADGTYREEFPVETLLPDFWTDPETGTKYAISHRIMGYQMVKLADGRETLGAILRREHVLPKLMQFDESSAFFGGSSLEEYLNTDYLVGCSPELRKAVTEVVIGESSPDDSRKVCCKVFIPSAEDLHVNIGDRSQNELDQLSWEYFRGTPTNWNDGCAKRIAYDLNGNAQPVWLRSHCGSSYVCYVYTIGFVSYDSPSGSFGVLPACIIIGANAKPESTNTGDGRQISA